MRVAKPYGRCKPWWAQFQWILLLAVVLLAGWLLLADSMNRHERWIEEWAAANDYRVESIERWHFRSPFWLWRRRGDDILEAHVYRGTEPERKIYARCNLWGMSLRWEDGTPAN